MAGSAAACPRGRRRPSWSRTQGRSLAGGKARAEDADPAKANAVSRGCGVAGPAISISREAIGVKTALIVNAASGSGRTTDAVEASLRQAGADVTVFGLGDERAAAASGVERL